MNSIYNNKFSLGPHITNFEKAKNLLSHFMVGYIYVKPEEGSDDVYDSTNLLSLKTPSCRIVEGILTGVDKDASAPFTLQYDNLTYNCHMIREVTFLNPKLDEVIKHLREELDKIGCSWAEFKSYINL